MFSPAQHTLRALVVGGKGGISSALVSLLHDTYIAQRNSDVGLSLVCTSRDQSWVDGMNKGQVQVGAGDAGVSSVKAGLVKAFKLDVTVESDFAAIVDALQTQDPEFRPNVIINATGTPTCAFIQECACLRGV